MSFPQYELCIGILQAGQGQKAETSGRGRVEKILLLDRTKQRMDANESVYNNKWNGINVPPDWKQVAGAIGGNSKLLLAQKNMSQPWWDTSRLQWAQNN